MIYNVGDYLVVKRGFKLGNISMPFFDMVGGVGLTMNHGNEDRYDRSLIHYVYQVEAIGDDDILAAKVVAATEPDKKYNIGEIHILNLTEIETAPVSKIFADNFIESEGGSDE